MRGSFIHSVSPRSSSRRPPEALALRRAPKTARITTSWVIACIRGQSSNGSPTGQRATSRRATSAIISRVGFDALAVEGGQHQLAPGHVLRFFQQHHRARAEHRAEQRVGDVDPDRAAGGEDLFDVVGVAEQDPVAPVRGCAG